MHVGLIYSCRRGVLGVMKIITWNIQGLGATSAKNSRDDLGKSI
jgi:hypothetical protein